MEKRLSRIQKLFLGLLALVGSFALVNMFSEFFTVVFTARTHVYDPSLIDKHRNWLFLTGLYKQNRLNTSGALTTESSSARSNIIVYVNNSASATQTSNNELVKNSEARVTGIPTDGSGFEVSVPVSGMLGNQMFQYASLLGIAHRNGRRPFYTSKSRLGAFHLSYVQDKSWDGFVHVSEDHFASYDPKFENLPTGNVIVMQYLQSWKYFYHIRDVIKREFTFKDNVKAAAANLLKKHADVIGNRTLIGVHVRRGDMLLLYHTMKGYHVAPASYVTRARDIMRQRHGDVIFVIVTQDIDYCRREFARPDTVIIDNAEVEHHLALLASCSHVIMTVGTLGWWAGYLSGGEVIYYWNDTVMISNPPKSVEIRTPSDFFLPEWTQVGD